MGAKEPESDEESETPNSKRRLKNTKKPQKQTEYERKETKNGKGWRGKETKLPPPSDDVRLENFFIGGWVSRELFIA